ncbi:unknown protein [Oryza sativa Japonica Group]|uniref:Os01g0668500 protein n=2 Tax=Oryza sativa subsp. japonica TaxID=39947 RepID=A0A0P0V6C2_ORYSJ|nr:hypothetical protein EE612_004886 [Oryza sativa]BAD73657.1 unknown protein [Oryza sativa Japonica Group]BAD73685.1 unknown protein [Oryza sativa Japonica Group]BAF05730.1 Os01g0668500 [Oryza sativa Japonica Group]BAS73603.1 Os01g0668500 [Oryza sativa Japonica Group]|eukprot:NP_001043816.1 Os01g0668500 [Oryza sativa Japonica Group]
MLVISGPLYWSRRTLSLSKYRKWLPDWETNLFSLVRRCDGSRVSVGQSKLCHTILSSESDAFITILPLLSRATVVCLPQPVLLSQTVVPLTSVKARLPSWLRDILEPWPFTGRPESAVQTTVLSVAWVNQMEK